MNDKRVTGPIVIRALPGDSGLVDLHTCLCHHPVPDLDLTDAWVDLPTLDDLDVYGR